MTKEFTIDFVSDPRYEILTAEISYKGQRVCQVNKERGDDHLEIEFISDFRVIDPPVQLRFELNDFLAVIEEVRTDLKRVHRR
jgi:hypothetical protein